MDIIENLLAPLLIWVGPWLAWLAYLGAVVACVVHRRMSPRMWVLGLGLAGMLVDFGWLRGLAGLDEGRSAGDRSVLVAAVASLLRVDALALIAPGLAFVLADLRRAIAAPAPTPARPTRRSLAPAAVLVAVLAGESLAVMALAGLPSLVEELTTTYLPWIVEALVLACLGVCVRYRGIAPGMGMLMLGFGILAVRDPGLALAASWLEGRPPGRVEAGLARAGAEAVAAVAAVQIARGLFAVFADARQVLPERAAVARAPGRLDPMAITAGALAAGSAAILLMAVARLVGQAGPGGMAASLLAGGTFGGFFTATLAGRHEKRNALMAGALVAIPSAALALLSGANEIWEIEQQEQLGLLSLKLGLLDGLGGSPDLPGQAEVGREVARLDGHDLWWAFARLALLWGIPMTTALVATFVGGAVVARVIERAPGGPGLGRGWTYLTDSGVAIPTWAPRRRPGHGRFWAGASGLFWVGIWTPVYLALTDPDAGRLGGAIARLLPMARDMVAFAAMALASRALARRSVATSAAEAMGRDPRPPIVYLRSFADEGRKITVRFLRLIFTAPYHLLKDTLEVRLDRAMRGLGPFVAIGRPGEQLPALGASRMYVADDHWREVVDDLLRRCQFVVLQAGDTTGLQWEVRHVAEAVAPERVLLFVPYALGRGRGLARREGLFRAFRRWADPLFPAGLPPTIGDAFFIGFRPSPPWEPFLLGSRRDVPADQPNRDALGRLVEDAMFRRRREFGPIASVLILVAAAVGIGWVVARVTAR